MSMTHVPAEMRRAVRERAELRCEYCLMPESHSLFPHEMDHVVAEKHGGKTQLENLCLSCALCNKQKGTDLTSIDPVTGSIFRLFRPREDRWSEHFRLNASRIEALTIEGRVTNQILRFNTPGRIAERRHLAAAGMIIIPA